MADVTLFDEKTFLADPLVIKAGGKDFIIPDEKMTTAFSLRQLAKIRDMQAKIEEMEKSGEGDKKAGEFMISVQCEFISDVLGLVDADVTPEWVRDNITARARPKLFEFIQNYQKGETGTGKNEGSGAAGQ